MDPQQLRQQLFTRAYTGLKAQGFQQAVNNGLTCMYRAPQQDGSIRRCAIGQLIANVEEARFFDGIGAVSDIYANYRDNYHDNSSTLIRFGKAIGAGDDVDTIDDLREFLIRLQQAHDNNGHPDRMKLALRVFAENHKLEVPS